MGTYHMAWHIHTKFTIHLAQDFRYWKLLCRIPFDVAMKEGILILHASFIIIFHTLEKIQKGIETCLFTRRITSCQKIPPINYFPRRAKLYCSSLYWHSGFIIVHHCIHEMTHIPSNITIQNTSNYLSHILHAKTIRWDASHWSESEPLRLQFWSPPSHSTRRDWSHSQKVPPSRVSLHLFSLVWNSNPSFLIQSIWALTVDRWSGKCPYAAQP